jgi:hypothetical protein
MSNYKKTDKGLWLSSVDYTALDKDKKSKKNGIKGELFGEIDNDKYTQKLGKKTSLKNSIPLSEVLEIITKFVSIMTIIAVLSGFLTIFSYLLKISHLHIFPNVVSSPSSAVAILVVYLIFSLIVAFGFLSSFMIGCNIFLIKKDFYHNNNVKIDNNYLIYFSYKIHSLNIVIFVILNIYILYIVLKIIRFSKYGFVYLLITFFLLLFIYNIKLLFNRISNIDNIVFSLASSLFSMIPHICYIYLIFILTLKTIREDYNQIILWVFSVMLFIFMFICSYFFTRGLFLGKRLSSYILTPLLMITCYSMSLFVFQEYEITLRKIGFMEKPVDSSWYIIHNGNNTSETINGITKDDTKVLQSKFRHEDMSQYMVDKPNYLYGYMAWNLGDTKVFCPQSVDFFMEDGIENKTKAQKCLVIDGKYLQLVSASLIDKT